MLNGNMKWRTNVTSAQQEGQRWIHQMNPRWGLYCPPEKTVMETVFPLSSGYSKGRGTSLHVKMGFGSAWHIVFFPKRKLKYSFIFQLYTCVRLNFLFFILF